MLVARYSIENVLTSPTHYGAFWVGSQSPTESAIKLNIETSKIYFK